jgi:hypothetical protein
MPFLKENRIIVRAPLSRPEATLYPFEGERAVRGPSDVRQKLPRSFYDRDTIVVARELLGKYLVRVSRGFGFVLHRQLVAAGAQSFLITPIALNGKRKTDKLDARALCLRLSRWLDGNRDELAPIRIPSDSILGNKKSSAVRLLHRT